MTPATRVFTVALTALVAAWLGTAACSDSNQASMRTADTTSGGAPATTPSDTGGSATTGGATSSDVDGSTPTGGSGPVCPTAEFAAQYPICGTNLAGTAIGKGVACVPEDVQLCYKTCGPEGIGVKSETCSGTAYVENSTCIWDPACDYSCYKLPEASDAACPTAAPKHNDPCTLPPCVVCGGTASGQTTGYLDSTEAAKSGFCICRPSVPSATADSGWTTQKWGCATAGTAWPCPGNLGC
jgi:hypothetical protein